MNGSESNSIVIDQNEGVSENVTEVYDTNMTSDNEETPMMQFLKQMRNYLSPFTLAVIIGGLFLCILISFGFCLVVRINSKPKRKSKGCERAVSWVSNVSSNWVTRSGSGYSGHTTLSTVSRSDMGTTSRETPATGQATSNYSSSLMPGFPSPTSGTLRRVSSYVTPLCISPTTRTVATGTLSSYPVVTPSATSFAGPRPTPVSLSLIPHAQYSNYCTAGLYQTRLRSPPRPVSCIAPLNSDYGVVADIPKAKLSTASISPPEARFDRDYMSIAECSEARKHSRSSGDLLDEEADGKDLKEKTNKRRGSVYL